MADVIRYVNTASSGGDGTTNGESGGTAAYASLTTWEAAEQADLTAGPDTHTVYCSAGSGTAADTTALSISGWTTSATSNIEVRANTGQEAGSAWDATKYRLEVSDGGSITFYAAGDVGVYGLQIWRNAASGSIGAFEFSVATTNNVVDSCFIRCGSASHTLLASEGICILQTGGTGTRIRNCVIVGETSGGVTSTSHPFGQTGINVENNTVGSARIYNNTIYLKNFSATTALRGALGSTSTNNLNSYIKNNIVICDGGDVENYYFPSVGAPSDATRIDYNAGTDTTLPGTNSRLSQTFTFDNLSNKNFGLALTDAGAKDYGVDLSTEGGFTVDIDGNTRATPWDIGASDAGVEPVGTFKRIIVAIG